MTFLNSRRGRQLVYTAFTVLLLAMIYIYFVKPIESERQETELKLERKQKEYELLLQKSSEETKEVSMEKFNLALVRSSIPEAPYTERLLEQLHMLEIVSGAEMNGYQFALSETENPAEPASKIYISTSVRGTYSQVIRLLTELRSSERVMVVEKLELVVPDSNNNTIIKKNVADPMVICHITLVSYYAPKLAASFPKELPAHLPVLEGRSGLLY